jgi:uncharacterized protein YbaA (DUF1428 family)
MPYVDGFLMVVPKRSLRAYRRVARHAGRLWRRHGAVEYRECVAEDLKVKFGVSIARVTKLRPGETVLFRALIEIG